MSKYLFPLLFLFAAATVSAQPETPPAPVYDPQGRLIPYDVRKDEPPVVAPARSSDKPVKAGKTKSSRHAKAKSVKGKSAKARAPKATKAPAGKSGKSGKHAKPSSRKATAKHR
ncbi:MAG TPA: hypothetical protein VGE56_05435 [Rhodocyclaceae bacterium]